MEFETLAHCLKMKVHKKQFQTNNKSHLIPIKSFELKSESSMKRTDIIDDHLVLF